jgi:hypothetical protein
MGYGVIGGIVAGDRRQEFLPVALPRRIGYPARTVASPNLLPASGGGTMAKISTQTRRELVATIQERYRPASLRDKQRILDEFVAVTGYHRKYAIRVLAPRSLTTTEREAVPSPRERVYGEAVREALGMLWEAADRVCGKRLKALLPTLVDALERHGHLTLDPLVRERLLIASPATIDRLLANRRATAGGRRRRPRARSAASRGIPIRTFADWKEPEPGFLEVDLVAHCGDQIGGSYTSTLVLTDVASGWTECIALLVRESALVVDAVDRLRTSMPFPLRGIDTDNGSEFIKRPSSGTAGSTGSHSLDRAPTTRTTKPGSNRRTARWCVDSSGTADSTDCVPLKHSAGSTPRRGCS